MLAAAILIFSSQSSAGFAASPGPAHSALGVAATVIRPASFSTMIGTDGRQSISLTNVDRPEVEVSGGSVVMDRQDGLIISQARSGPTVITLTF